MTRRLTPAQRRCLALLNQPGAEAHIYPHSAVWWTVWVDGQAIGRAHAESLGALREAGYVTWRGGEYPMAFRQFITHLGRLFVAEHPARGDGGGAG